MSLTNDELTFILNKYGIESFEHSNLIDTSHGDNDIRHNYIIDKKYVLRINSAKVMKEERIKELNTLIKRYNDFGLKAPYFLLCDNDKYLLEYKNYYCYLSEYLDLEIADNVKDKCRKELIKERVIFVSRFANKYKNIDLVETMSMYSLFDLCPYDQLIGIDEKQDNFNTLIQDLESVNEIDFANQLKEAYNNDRKELLSLYKELPRCVFQGDENFSNLCVDENNHIIGLFDFNMSGTEVIANYLANISLQGNYFYEEEIMERCSAKEIFRMVIDSFNENTNLIKRYYTFEDKEFRAYMLYVKIAMISGYWNQYAFSEYLKKVEYKDKIISLLKLIMNV